MLARPFLPSELDTGLIAPPLTRSELLGIYVHPSSTAPVTCLRIVSIETLHSLEVHLKPLPSLMMTTVAAIDSSVQSFL